MHLTDAILDELPVRVYFKDTDGRFVYLNRAAADALGVAADAAVGTTDHDYFRPPHADRARADEQRIVRTRTPVRDQREREEWADGRVTWVLTTKLPWLADDGATVRGIVGLTKDVSEQVRETDRLERLLDATPALVFVKDQELRFRYVNRAVADALGRPKDDIIGKTDDDLLPDRAQVAGFRTDDRRVLDGPDGEVVATERLTDIRGQRRSLSTRKVKYHPDPGGPAEVLGVATDITEQVAARDEARREQALLAQLMDNVPDGIFFKSPDGRFTRVNKELARLVGRRDPGALVGLTDWDVFDPAFAAASEAEERDLVATRTSKLGVVRQAIGTADGPRWRLVSKAPIEDDGVVTAIVGISKDITTLKNTEQRLQLILDTIPQCVFVKDRELRYQMVNNALLRRHGLRDKRELEGKTDFDRGLPTAAAGRYRWSDEQVLATGKPFEDTETLALDGGRPRTIHTRKFPLTGADGQVEGVLGMLTDITQQQEDERLRFQLRIASSIRHCLRNWLSQAEGNMVVLAGQLPALAANDRWRGLGELFRRLKRAADLATKLAATDRIAADRRVPVSVPELVRGVVAAHHDPRLVLGPLPPALDCPAVEYHLENAVMELITNAREAAPKDGGRIDVWVEADGAVGRIHVRDNGPGVPPAARAALFTGDLPIVPRNTGLGLVYVREVVEHHPGATVREVGGATGAHFVIELPADGAGGRP